MTELDVSGQQVRVRDLQTTKEWWESYDRLLIATGAVAIRPNIPGIESKGVLSVNSLQSGIEARRFVDERKPKCAVIVGGGYIVLPTARINATMGGEKAVR